MRTLLAAVLVAMSAGRVAAQVVAAPALERGPQSARSTLTLVAAGAAGGAIGFYLGAYAGGNARAGCEREGGGAGCGRTAAGLGAVIGEAVLMPVAVHLANGRHGDLGKEILVSAAVPVAAVLSYAVIGKAGDALIIAVPVTQIWSAIHFERAR